MGIKPLLLLMLVFSFGLSLYNFLRFRTLPDRNHDFLWNKQRYENRFLVPSVDVLLCLPLLFLLRETRIQMYWQFGVVVGVLVILLIAADITERAVRDRALQSFGQDFGKMTLGKWVFTCAKAGFLFLWLNAWLA